MTNLQALTDQLHLHHLAAALPDHLDRASREELSYSDFLAGLFEVEAVQRLDAQTRQRIEQAGFPFAASIEQFDFKFRPELKRQLILRYLDPSFVAQAASLTLIGPPGLGKTMLAIAIATKQIQLGATAYFVSAQTLATQIGRIQTTVGRQRILKPLLTCDVLVVDELGYLPSSPGFGPFLYEIVANRYERKPIIITSNKSLTEWATITQDVSLATAIADRLLHHGEVFYLRGPSWRLKGRAPEPPPATEPATS